MPNQNGAKWAAARLHSRWVRDVLRFINVLAENVNFRWHDLDATLKAY
jgi:hypothetical protein